MDYLLLVEPRQQGKTSLINRLMRTEALRNVSICLIDVSTLDVTAEENWYRTLCGRILPQLQRLFLATNDLLFPPATPAGVTTYRKSLPAPERQANELS